MTSRWASHWWRSPDARSLRSDQRLTSKAGRLGLLRPPRQHYIVAHVHSRTPMTVSYDDVEKFIREEVASFSGQKIENVAADTVLLGAGRVVDSADLVMLLLAAEDFSREKLGASFDWTSDSAMSEARSVLRNVGSLAKHLVALQTG